MATGLGAALQRIKRAFHESQTTAVVELATPDATTLLGQAEAEINRKASEALAEIDRVTTKFGALEREVAALRPQVELWQRRLAGATTDALRVSAGERLLGVQKHLELKQNELEEARPEAEAVLKFMDEVGFNRDEALSETHCLQIKAASAAVRLRLAKAHDAFAMDEDGTQKLVAQAQDQIYRTAGEAEVREELAGIAPKK